MNILFQGDSITDAGRTKSDTCINIDLGGGYVTLVASHLTSQRDDIFIANKGVYGNRTEQLHNRWCEDTLSFDFDVLSLLCGINDVGFDLRMGICGNHDYVYPFYDKMMYQVKEKNPQAKIILMTPFVFKKHYDNPEFGDDIYENYNTWHDRVVEAGELTKEIGKKYGASVIPLFDIFKELLKTNPVEKYTQDCVHLTIAGHTVIAEEWLKVFNKLCL